MCLQGLLSYVVTLGYRASGGCLVLLLSNKLSVGTLARHGRKNHPDSAVGA